MHFLLARTGEFTVELLCGVFICLASLFGGCEPANMNALVIDTNPRTPMTDAVFSV